MTAGDDARGFSLKRWSRRKLAAARGTGTVSAMSAPAAQVPADGAALAPGPSANVPRTSESVPPDVPGVRPNPSAEARTLPPVESLTPQSDFTAFLRPDVEEGLKRAALKQLFRDPRFNVMDGLDVYVDDYSKPDPIPPEILRQLVQARSIFNPPATRVNAQGFVEDVPPEELAPEQSAPGTVPPALADAPTPTAGSSTPLRGSDLPQSPECGPVAASGAKDSPAGIAPVPADRSGS